MSIHVENSARRTFVAGEDLSAKQYYIVMLDTAADNEVILATGATGALIGVLGNTPEEGDNADVLMSPSSGTFKVKAGGNLSINSKITSDANGKAVATTTEDDIVIGIALHSAVDGDIVEYKPVFYPVPPAS